jgi:release factor glutamine methyltransferase
MTLGQALQQATSIFNSNNIEDAQLEARILLGYLLKLSAVELYTEIKQNLNVEQEKIFRRLIERRLHREPAAYILNQKEFYGLDFYVDNRVHIPRPETELLIEEALKFAHSQGNCPALRKKTLLAADIGTGCGNIAICLALEIANIEIFAVDLSSAALEVARLNCERHKVNEKITLLHGNLLEPLSTPVDLIAANLPYIKSSELDTLDPEIVLFEPRIALNGGKEGLKWISQLLTQANEKMQPGGCLIIEIGNEQEYSVVNLINQHLPNATIELVSDLNNIKRVVKINI